MSVETEENKILVNTQIGVVATTKYSIRGYDVDNMSKDRTESYLLAKQYENVASTIDPYASKDSLIKSSDVEDVNG